MNRSILFLIALLVTQLSAAQSLQIIFHPANPYFYNTDQAWNYSVINASSKPVTGSLEVAIFRGGSFQIYHSETGIITLLPGENFAQLFTSKITSTLYSSDQTGTYFRNTGLLPAGSFSMCVWVKSVQNAVLNNACQELNINAITLPILTYPYDQEVLNTTFPQLTWIPVMPQGIPQLQYLLELWEAGTNGIIARGSITSLKTTDNTIQYNATLPQLETGKQYRWQVSAYVGSYYLGKSQNWLFKIGDDNSSSYRSPEVGDTSEELPDTDSYRVIADETYGAEYVATGILKVAFNNIAMDSLFNYKISLVDQPEEYLEELPSIKITNGFNKISLDLASTGLFQNQKDYTLEIEDGNGKSYYLTFLYLTP